MRKRFLNPSPKSPQPLRELVSHLGRFLSGWLLIGSSSIFGQATNPTSATQPSPEPQKFQGSPNPGKPNPLTDGLVDELLRAPPTPIHEKAEINSSLPLKTPSALPRKEEVPANIDSKNPLDAIQVEMIAASRRFMRGDVSSESLQLQNEILQRFDEMIASIDQSQRDSTKAESTKNTNSSVQKDPAQSNAEKERRDHMRPQKDKNADRFSEGREPDPKTRTGGQGNSPPISSPTQETTTPWRELRTGIWGHLPERTRRQMQSTTVDRFHPLFREQIEEYYRRLSTESK